MRLYDINGKLKFLNVSKYRIQWEKSSRSNVQFLVKQFLKQYWTNNIVYEEFPVYGSRMKVDILNATKKIAIEVNGKQHDKFNSFFHNGSRLKYLNSIKRDSQKAKWLEDNQFLLVEINEEEAPNISKDFFLNKYNITL